MTYTSESETLPLLDYKVGHWRNNFLKPFWLDHTEAFVVSFHLVWFGGTGV